MYLDDAFAPGSGHSGPWCCACREPILEGQRSTRIAFNSDPTGSKGLSGEYHLACSKPFASLAHVINLDPWAGR